MDIHWLIAILLSSISLSYQITLDDCIAEKYFRFTKEHTACVTMSSSATKSGISLENQEMIVEKHNDLRALQGAANMEKMVWDDEIAAIAQRWADNCDFNHDQYRSIPGRFSLGQNLALGYSTWGTAIDGWYNEIDLFTYGSEAGNSFPAVGHYTQLVWAQSSKIGCGYSYCENLNANYYACNYGPAGNSDWWEPYKQGAPCADCPNSCDSDKLCDCGGKVCENGGTLNLDTCECTCTKPWHIEGICGLNCSAVVEPTSCEPGGFYDGKCFVYSNVPDECPNMCNICPYSSAEYVPDVKDEKDDNSAPSPNCSSVALFLSLMSSFSLLLN